jgi:hypothetical protein
LRYQSTGAVRGPFGQELRLLSCEVGCCSNDWRRYLYSRALVAPAGGGTPVPVIEERYRLDCVQRFTESSQVGKVEAVTLSDGE